MSVSWSEHLVWYQNSAASQYRLEFTLNHRSNSPHAEFRSGLPDGSPVRTARITVIPTASMLRAYTIPG